MNLSFRRHQRAEQRFNPRLVVPIGGNLLVWGEVAAVARAWEE
jgi:hypothetical protein